MGIILLCVAIGVCLIIKIKGDDYYNNTSTLFSIQFLLGTRTHIDKLLLSLVIMLVVEFFISVVLLVAVGFQVGLQDSELFMYLVFLLYVTMILDVTYTYTHIHTYVHCRSYLLMLIIIYYLDTCDSTWQLTRNNLIISAFVFSLLCTILILMFTAFAAVILRCGELFFGEFTAGLTLQQFLPC